MLPAEILKENIDEFIRCPFPLWETALTGRLVATAYEKLQTLNINDRLSYQTASALLKKELNGDKQFLVTYGQKPIYLESPDYSNLTPFYLENGLIPLTKSGLVKERAATKLKAAMNLLAEIPDCIDCIASLVSCIQVIVSEGPEYDTSYSHPNIPFTIFVSICEDDDEVSNFRVAEGILHEAMHLKLSLIQKMIALTEPDSTETFYSPWRDAPRPLMGVMHGIFVFKAIQDFAKICLDKKSLNDRAYNHLTYRLNEINTDFKALSNFCSSRSLTPHGVLFASQLLTDY